MAEILIYGIIGKSFWDDDAVSAGDVLDALNAIPTTESSLDIRVNSVGGLANDGIAMHSAIRSYANKRRIFNENFKVRGIVDGYAYSAATLPLMACDEIVMNTGTMLMIHNAWGLAVGNAAEFREAADYFDKLDGNIAAIYAKRTGRKSDDLMALMNATTYFTPEEAKAAKLIDTIDEAAKASLNLWEKDKDAIAAFQKQPNLYREFLNQKAAKAAPGGVVTAAAAGNFRLRLLELETAI